MDYKLFDKRTREGQEREVLGYVRTFGGLSIFWITDNQKRANAVQRLEDSGRIVRHMRSKRNKYPWCVYSLAKEKK